MVLFSILKRRHSRRQIEASKEEDKIVIRSKPKKDTESLPMKFKTKPRVIFVGSSKGGVGKSFIASTLVDIIAAHNSKPVYAVDSDLDNSTLSSVLIPPEIEEKLQRTLIQRNIEYLNFADALLEGVTGRQILKFTVKLTGCGGSIIPVSIRLIPTYHALKKRSQMIALRDVDVLQMRDGMNSLIDFLTSRNGIVVIDGKQKSNLSINLDPIYAVAKERSDVIIIVTEPPYLSFNTITAQYQEVLDKSIIVVNKVDSANVERVAALASDAIQRDIPLFIVPKAEKYAEKYRDWVSPGVELGGTVSKFVGAIAMYLNLVEECNTNCCDVYRQVLEKELEALKVLKLGE